MPEVIKQADFISISEVSVGDVLINIGKVLEIEERENDYSLVIERMQERQVWKFHKNEELAIKI